VNLHNYKLTYALLLLEESRVSEQSSSKAMKTKAEIPKCTGFTYMHNWKVCCARREKFDQFN